MWENKSLGIDIGGSHISARLVDLDSLEVLDDNACGYAVVNPNGTAEEIIETWASVIEACFQRYPLKEKRIGIAMPGPFDYEQGISRITGLRKFESLYGLNIKRLLAGRLSIPPANIRMLNDASAFLLGEVMGGAGRGYRLAAGITLGTGVGSARFIDGTVQDGDFWCTLFRGERVEDCFCSAWFAKQYAGISGTPVEGVKDLLLRIDAEPRIQSIFTAFGQNLAEALLEKYPPEVQDIIIIGGNISKAWELFMPAARDYLRSKGTRLNLQPALLGENAAIAGASFLWA